MKDIVIDAAQWHLKSDPQPDKMLVRIQESYEPLLRFLQQNSLLRDKEFERKISDWSKFELKVSDLTLEGDELVKRCHDKWLSYLDREGDRKNLRTWEKELIKMRD